MSDAPTSENAKSETVRILLVEDDAGDALLLQNALSDWPYGTLHIRRAGDLFTALQDAAQEGIDLVLLDLGLPDSRGIETFVRLHAAAARVPIVVLSGLEDESLATKAVQQGAQDYIVKGKVDGASLARAIRYAIERCRAQQALAKEHDLLRGLIDNIPDQVYVKDTDSRFVAANPMTAAFFGASSSDQIIGKCDFDFFPHELAAQFLAEEQVLLRRDQPCVNREAAITDSAGNTRWVLTSKVPLRDHDGNITGLLGINRDITDRKQAERAIRRLNAELEQRVTDRTIELRKAMARLEEQDRARSEFVSTVSHELRAPLASMRYEIANMLEGVAGPVPAPVTRYLQLLNTDCQRMATTVEDILDLSRLESSTMRLQRAKVPFDRLIRRGATALRGQAQAKNMEMILSAAPALGFVECDALKTERAIINIIGNAIKFTPDGGTVEIGLHREATPPGALVVEVTDTGIGIAPQHLARVAEKYFRAGEHVSGAGLGLFIAKEIVELHGGRLAIQSPPPERERGTRVSVSMPAAEPPTLLVASDDETIAHLLAQQLGAYGYHVIACAGGDTCLDRARRDKPDVCILEVSMSAVGGADLVVRMKADPDLHATPIVALADGTAGPAKQEILKGLGIPMLPRPWREEDLLDRIEAAIRRISSSSVSTA